MRTGVKRAVGWVAIYAVAVHTLLTGFDPALAAVPGSFDPLAITCLTGDHDNAAADTTGSLPNVEKVHACKHCILCGATISFSTAPDTALADTLTPERVLHTLHPASTARPADIATAQKLARGPPSFA